MYYVITDLTHFFQKIIVNKQYEKGKEIYIGFYIPDLFNKHTDKRQQETGIKADMVRKGGNLSSWTQD